MKLPILLFSFLLASNAHAAEDWPQFRGPGGDGKAPEANVPLTWSESENVHWKTPIHGRGWSSPVIWGDQIWLQTATLDGRKMYAVAVELNSGKVLHDILVFENENPAYCHPANTYASCTPVVEQGRVYVHFGVYGTACLDTASGEKLWERRDFPCDHWRGPGSSPILVDDLLFVAFDGYDVQYVVALDKHTGQTLWRRDRNIDYGPHNNNGDRKKAYSTAALIEHDGQRQIISPSAGATVSYDPKTGAELWRVNHGGMNAAARPIYQDGLVYITAGDRPYAMVAVRPDVPTSGSPGDITDSHIEWTLNRATPKRSSQILHHGAIYMASDDGVASCVDAATGEIVWQRRLGGEYWASPLCASGRVYFFSKDGHTHVIAADRDFRRLAENRLDAGFWASPAVSGDRLVLRTETHLYCIEQGSL